MTTGLVWILAVACGATLCGTLGSLADLLSSLAAAGVVMATFLITARIKVASRLNVSKMGTAWLTQELRQMVWRMLLTMVLAALVFRLMYPEWAIAFWLSVAAYYQVGLLLHLREIRRIS